MSKSMIKHISSGFAHLHWTVSELTQYVRDLIDSDHYMQDVNVVGELSNVSRPKSGHIYFSLKDSKSVIQCVVWRSIAARSVYLPENGDKVILRGNVSLYQAGGRCQLYVNSIQTIGAGDALLQTEVLKEKLALEGLFDSDKKIQLPEFPLRILIVTSPDAAAYYDMLNVIERRWPIANTQLISTVVQGVEAPQEIVKALDVAKGIGADVILLGRGGGSPDDLIAFNAENVVRAVAEMTIPIVAGIGHETDLTLVDLAADVRAPTPSAAAELATPDYRVVYQQLNIQMERAKDAINSTVKNYSLKVDEMEAMLNAFSPVTIINHARHRLVHTYDLFVVRIRELIVEKRSSANRFVYTLIGLKPTETLNRGYSIVVDSNSDKIIIDGNEVEKGQLLDIVMSKGKIIVEVVDVFLEEEPYDR